MKATVLLGLTAALGSLVAVAFAPLWLAGMLGAVWLAGTVVAGLERPKRLQVGTATVAPDQSALAALHTDVVLLVSEDGVLQAVTPSIENMLGWDEGEFASMRVDELVHPDDMASLLDAYRGVREGGMSTSVDIRVRGSRSWVAVEVRLHDHRGDLGGYLVQLLDRTRHGTAMQGLHRREAALDALAHAAAHALEGSDEATLVAEVVTSGREVLAAGGCEIYQTTGTAPELLGGVGPGGMMLDRRSTTLTGAALAAAASESGEARYQIAGQPVREIPEGALAEAVAVPIGTLGDTDGALLAHSPPGGLVGPADLAFLQGLAGIVALARRRRGAEQAAFRRSRHDQLTGLVNREVFLERLETSISRCGLPGETVAVLLVDLDHFKIINDSLGHAAGDALLEAVSDRLADGLRPGDTLARFGGDEFVVLARRLGDPAHARLAADRLQSVLSRPFTVAGHEVFVTASVGVAVCEESTADAGSLVQEADAALYRAKELGRERVTVFEPTLLDAAVTRLRVEEELREALADEQLRVFYQPIVDLGTGRSERVEGLVRWVHPRRGLVAPAEFIPISERTGLIEEIGAWVIDEVAEQARVWADQGTPMRVSVNLSDRQISDQRLPEVLADALTTHAVPPSAIAVEVTDQALVPHADATMRILRNVADLGVGIVIDDFGTGYASVQHWRTLPIELVKIDGSLVRGIARSGEDYELVRAVIGVARLLGHQVAAEGVETEEQLELLRDLGCDLAQGFLFSPAVFDVERTVHEHDWTKPLIQRHH